MSKISDSAPPDTSFTGFGFSEVDFPGVPQPRLAVRFSDGLQLLLCDSSDLDLAAQLIFTVRLVHQRQEKGATRSPSRTSLLQAHYRQKTRPHRRPQRTTDQAAQGYLWVYRAPSTNTVYYDWETGRGLECLLDVRLRGSKVGKQSPEPLP